MDALLRLLMRFLLVPLGMVVAVIAAVGVAAAANWAKFMALLAEPVLDLATILAAVALLAVQSIAVAVMLVPGAIGIVLSEAFAIRSWWFHAPLGGLSIWIGWTTMDTFRNQYALYEDRKVVIAAGLAAGFAYWAVAGWNAGFWKPVFQSDSRVPRAGEARPDHGNAAGSGNLL